jgi:hypothetical protein
MRFVQKTCKKIYRKVFNKLRCCADLTNKRETDPIPVRRRSINRVEKTESSSKSKHTNMFNKRAGRVKQVLHKVTFRKKHKSKHFSKLTDCEILRTSHFQMEIYDIMGTGILTLQPTVSLFKKSNQIKSKG